MPDLGQVGAAVLEALDAALEDAGDLVWLDLHCRSLLRPPWRLAFEVVRVGCGRLRRAPCCRRGARGRRARRGRPSRSARPSGRSAPRSACRSRSTSSSSSSTALVTVTGSSLFSSAHSASNSRRMRKITGIRWRSASSSRKLRRRSSASLTILPDARPSSPPRRSRARRRRPAGRGPRRARRRTRRARRARGRATSFSLADLEQRARVDLGDLLHSAAAVPFRAGAAPRSRPRRAPPRSSRRWSSSSSDLRVTFSVASTVRSATSLRISSSARRVSASMSRRVWLHQLLALLLGLAFDSSCERARPPCARGRRCPPPARAPPQPGAVLLEQLVGLALGLLAGSIDSSIALRRLSSASAMRGKASLLSR